MFAIGLTSWAPWLINIVRNVKKVKKKRFQIVAEHESVSQASDDKRQPHLLATPPSRAAPSADCHLFIFYAQMNIV